MCSASPRHSWCPTKTSTGRRPRCRGSWRACSPHSGPAPTTTEEAAVPDDHPTDRPAGPVRHVLEVDDLGPDGLAAVLGLAAADPAALPRTLAGRGVALVFEKPSARTRNSSELATVALGGHPVHIRGSEVGIDTRESAEDVARTLACFHHV